MTASILITSQLNDKDLRIALGSVAISVPIRYGDCCWTGVGSDSQPLKVLVERKKIRDMVNSILGGRYLYQAQSAHDAGWQALWLIVEGQCRANPEDGLLEVPAWLPQSKRSGWKPVVPAITYHRFDTYLTELEVLAGIRVKRSYNVRETANQIKSLWAFYSIPPSKHGSLNQIYTPPSPIAQLRKPSLIRRMAKELKNVGWERSGDIANRFSSVAEMVAASDKDWCSIPGIGKSTAESIVRELH